MAASSGVFEAMYEYYSTLMDRGMGVLRGVREDIRDEQFDANRFMAQALGLWLDASAGWWSALQLSTSPRLAGMFVGVPAGQVGKANLTIRIPSAVRVTVTELRSADGGVLPKVKVEAGAQRDELVATATPSPDTVPGIYQGWVHAGDRVLALLVVHVTPGEPVRAAKARQAPRPGRRR